MAIKTAHRTKTIKSSKVKNQPGPSSRKKSTLAETWFVLCAVILALGLLIYPVASTQLNNYRQHQIAQAYANDIKDSDPTKLDSTVKSAQRYNQTHSAGPILDPWNDQVSKDNEDYQEYLGELHDLDLMSEITIPGININLPVYHGTEEDTLEKGLGHLYGTSLPVGGKGTHSVITGHTGLPEATMFDDLVNMKAGDEIYVNTYGKKMKYLVYEIEVVLPHETDSLKPQANQDLMTLITCTPYGVNSHRLLIHAHRVDLDEDVDSSEISPFHLNWWMIVFLLLAFLALEALVVWVLKTHKKVKSWNKKIDRHYQVG